MDLKIINWDKNFYLYFNISKELSTSNFERSKSALNFEYILNFLVLITK